MDALFQLSAPWWVFVLRALVVYVLVTVLMRLSGKRSVGQFTPFDLVLLILLGNSVQNGINGGDNSLTGAAIMASTLIAVNYLVALATSRSRLAERLLEGEPVVLARHGRVFDHVLRRELISKTDFHEAMRMNDVDDVGEIALALLETNGHITILKKSDRAGRD
ncbi:DUF421 domain-containing protein [Thermomonas sp. S9]|uniref:DUF421 domain-containing protein n=1 Tax=Thermomonas sp. S9 TaxID=2885203 RepID=UPI00216ABB7E|nr:YetF domain-containing protein [Thermomonas sp. S9]MCR6494969.1 DUF421 domain-containing protein [Thermomonas sp. S9]